MIEKLVQAPANIVWLWGMSAWVFGIGVGAVFAGALGNFGLWLFLVGLAAHLWMMWRVYGRK